MHDLTKIWPRLFLTLTVLALAGAAQARPVTALPDFSGLVERTSPAVVNISTEQRVSKLPERFHGFEIPDLPEDSPFHDFLKRFLDEEGRGLKDFDTQSLGSGFIVSEDGYVVTNHHVVHQADEIVVRLSDRREFVARVVGSDKQSDIALLKIDAEGLPTVTIAPRDKPLKVGEWVLAIGSPFGFDHSATAGIVSAKGRNLPSENYVPFIQTDVAINPGNSGGPLFNLDGEVVGVNSQIYSRTGGFMGLSFAIPIDVAMNVIDQLRADGRVTRGWLGVLIQDVTRDLADSFGMELPRGALISRVLPDSPAEAAGLQPGDVILRYNGIDVPSSASLPPLVGATAVEESAELSILRNGERRKIKVEIGELPDQPQLAAGGQTEPGKVRSVSLGLVVADISDDQREALGIGDQEGVVVSEVQPGPARTAGLRDGDVILMIDNKRIEGTDAFRSIVDELPAGKSVAVLVQRDTGPIFLAMRVPR
ncbi:MAG: DegQ family serine endoprotease [Chromatiales bacterium]|jgi:serine protease Do